MRKSRRMLAAALAAVTVGAGILGPGTFPALASAPTGPGAAPPVDRYDPETLARLTDNVLEYDEIANRVRDYNPAISEMWDNYRKSKSDYENILTELESQARAVEDLAEDYAASGDLMNSGILTNTENELKKTAKSTRETIAKWDGNAVNTKTIRKYEQEAVAGAQQAMIGYDSIRKSNDTMATMVDLYQRQYDSAVRRLAEGLATEADVLSAQASLLSAQSQMADLNAKQESTRRALCELLGYDPDSSPEIRPIPAFDMARIDGMDLEQDTVKAIGNNYTLIGQRNSGEGKTNSQAANRARMIEEGDQKLTIEINRLYQDVMDKKAAYEAAQTGFEAAGRELEAGQTRFQNGLISEIQFVGVQLSYYQKKAAMETADLSLLQAMETYGWGVTGLATVE